MGGRKGERERKEEDKESGIGAKIERGPRDEETGKKEQEWDKDRTRGKEEERGGGGRV